MLAALPPCFVLLALPSSLWPMLALSAVAGCMIAPLTAAESQLTVLVAPRGSATEAVTWIVMATVVGLAAGNALAGVLVQASGWRAAVLCACALGAVGAGLTVARRRTLQAVPVAGGA
jgi:predicted MFS family arabinose efflux permease